MKFLRFFLKGFGKGIKDFGEIFGFVVNSVILLVVYVIGIGFSSILAKLLRKMCFETKPSEKKSSYWTHLEIKENDSESFYRQF